MLKLTIKTSERRQWRSGVFIVNFEHISHLALLFLLLTLNMQLPGGKELEQQTFLLQQDPGICCITDIAYLTKHIFLLNFNNS